MQNDPNNRPYYYTPPRVAGRLIGQKPSNTGLWASFRQQSRGIQIGVASIAVLVVILVLLVPYVLFSGLFSSTQSDQVAANPSQNAAAVTAPATADIPTAAVTDTPTPAPAPVAAPTISALDQSVTSNPWGYDFNPGSFITAPPATFCTYFSCITGFWNGQGYVEECQDGTYTLAGGVGGDCDAHGGDLRPLYYHPSLAPAPAPPPAPAPTPIPAAPRPTATSAPKPTATAAPRPKLTPTPIIAATPTPKTH